MALVPILCYVGGPLTFLACYLDWKFYDSPWKGPFWDGGMDFGAFVWLAACLFFTVAAIAFGDFARLFRHLFRRQRS